jgi:hypothetical protein
MKHLFCFLLISRIMSAQVAFTFANGGTLTPDSHYVIVSGNGGLILTGPGDYNATVFAVSGGLTLPQAGLYRISATSITINGGLQGPADGRVALLVKAAVFNAPSPVPGNVLLTTSSDEAAAFLADSPSSGTNGPVSAMPLIAVSTRMSVQSGQVLTTGFVVGGKTARRVLVRAVGPGLTQFGLTGVMPDPRLTLFSGQTVVAANDNWGGGADLAAAFVSCGEFGLPGDSRDAAVIATLSPGAYTVQATGVTGGDVLLEVYLMN